MTRGKVYLAGPITGLSYGETMSWRDVARNRLAEWDIEGLCPMRGKSYLQNEASIAATYADTNRRMSSGHAIFKRDKYDCQRSDALLVNLADAQKISIGTMFELAWAEDVGIPIVIIMELSGAMHEHPFVTEASYVIVPTLDEGIATIVTLLGVNE